MSSATEEALRRHVKEFQSLNASSVSELDAVPSPVEFARFVAANRPVVVRAAGQAVQIPALERWTDEYLVERLADRELDISATPEGNADAIVDGVFVEPANIKMTISTLFAHLREEQDDPSSTAPVFYLQSQNGNLADEYEALQDDVGREGPAFAREVFGQPPDVANIWVGGRRSKTSLHKDPYQNIYMVVRGTKTFTLFPPSEFYCMHEALFPHATYSFSPSTSTFSIARTTPPLALPWIPIDPLAPSLAAHPRFALARPLQVTLERGDMLYLPALWFHFVEQDVGWGPGGAEGGGTKAAVAVNWWTDMDFGAPVWAGFGLVRRLTMALDGREEEAAETSEDEE
ncbi:hypothetical protein JCM10449v2_002996 [Rhodotorula kratochvilovae]